MSTLTYRADIDGLRAVAVSLVLLYHADVPPFTGGFVGVDVFFVISGFLITSIVQTDGAQFSFARFYERRARRILPPLLVVAAASLGAAVIMFIPADLVGVGASAVAAVLFGSNFLFQDQAGYFDAAAGLKPLLHTWSLSLEQQFYLAQPCLLVGLAALGRRAPAVGLAVVFVVSLAISALTSGSDPAAAYFLLPARAWELCAGALLAMCAPRAPRRDIVASATAVFGLLMIGASALTFTPQTAFPGVAAALPVAGAVLVIWSGQRAPRALRVLTVPPVVAIGLASYSLYLWHWPVFVFARYAQGGELNAVLTVCALALSGALAALTFLYVERPARSMQGRSIVLGAGGVASAVCVVAAVVLTTAGLPQRVGPEAAAILAASRQASPMPCETRIAGECVYGAARAAPSFLFVGDSHAGATSRAFIAAASETGRAGYVLSGPGFCPLPGVTAERQPMFSAPMPRFIEIMERLPAGSTVVVACYWQMRTSLAHEFRKFEFRDEAYDGSGARYNATCLQRGLERLASQYSNHRIFLLEDVPTGWALDPSAAARVAYIWGTAKLGERMGISRAAYETQRAAYLPVLRGVASRHAVTVVPVADAVCDDRFCPGWRDGQPLYVDDDHVSEAGADALRGVFRTILAARPRRTVHVSAAKQRAPSETQSTCRPRR